MAGTVTAAESKPGIKTPHRIVTWDWLSDGSGNADGTFTGQIHGLIWAVKTIPGSNGDLTTNLPTANYDVTITDQDLMDVLGGSGADRSGTAAEQVQPTTDSAKTPRIINATLLKLNITNAGSAKAGRVRLFIEDR